MSSLKILLVSVLFLGIGAAPANDDDADEAPVTYSGYQLWSATPRTDEEREFLLKLQTDYGETF